MIKHLAALAVTALLAGACVGGAPTAPPLSDPAEIVERALVSSGNLRAVHVRLDFVPAVGGAGAAALDADVDLISRELSLVALAPGSDAQRLRLADGALYLQSGDDPWRREPQGVAGALELIPPTKEIVVALTQAVGDPSVEHELVGTEDCGEFSCYHVRVLVPPSVVWRTLTELVPLAAQGEEPPGMTGLALDAWVDRGHLRLIQLKVGLGGSGTAAVTLSNHDKPVFIDPPPGSQIAP